LIVSCQITTTQTFNIDRTTTSANQENIDRTTTSANQEKIDRTTTSANQENIDGTTTSANQKNIDRTTTSANQENRFCCSAVIRQSLIDKGVSIEDSAFIISSWRKETTKQYILCWRKLVLWCGGRVKNPFTASKIDVVEYLIHLVNINSSYSVINTHKYMLMQTLLFCGTS
jgi:hypothetical protein